MKIFISWSGARSKATAELLRSWIACVLQATKPWISTRDLDRGTIWFTEINDQLKDTSIGIICLTQENKERPWILFEAGALTKGLSSNRVCTLLIDLQPADVRDPLAQFNHTIPNENGMRELLRTLNDRLGKQALSQESFEEIFAMFWPKFQSGFEELLKANQPNQVAEPRKIDDVLVEILESVRAISARTVRMEPEVSSPQPEVMSKSIEDYYLRRALTDARNKIGELPTRHDQLDSFLNQCARVMSPTNYELLHRYLTVNLPPF